MSGVVAVFDVDGTLLRGDCLWIAGRCAGPWWQQLRAAVGLLPSWLAWQLRLIRIEQFKGRAIGALALCEAANAASLHGGEPAWLLSPLQRQLRPLALQRLRWHQRRGDRVLLVSASPRLLLQPLADWLGVELLCTELVRVDGHWRPQLSSPNCKGPEKVRRLRAHLGPLQPWTIEAYGDSQGDRELLQAATRPHYRSFGPEPRPYPTLRLAPLLPLIALVMLAYGLLGLWSQGPQLLLLIQDLGSQIALGLLLVLLGYAIRYGRWRLLLAVVGAQPPLADDSRIWMGSYAFTATPGKSGEAVRALLLKQHCRVPMPQSLMALVVERLSDGTAVLALLLLNGSLLWRWRGSLLWPLAWLAAILAVVAVLSRRHAVQALIQAVAMRGARRLLPRNLAGAGVAGLAALQAMLQPPVLLAATAAGALAWSLEGVSLWLLLRGLGNVSIGIGGATIAHTTAGLFGALTLLPGGLGSTEAGTIGLLVLQGVATPLATPATVLIRLMTLWFATVLGAFCLLLGQPR